MFVKFSKPATDDGATLNGRAVRAGTTGAPIFEEAIAWLDCEVRHTLDLGSHTLFVGELVDASINDDAKRPASMADTRMKYGGVKRGGHSTNFREHSRPHTGRQRSQTLVGAGYAFLGRSLKAAVLSLLASLGRPRTRSPMMLRCT